MESTHSLSNRQYWWGFTAILALYIGLRLLSWFNTVLLEDTDSVNYLRHIRLFLDFDLARIIDMEPDMAPFYLAFGALFSLPGWPVEVGGRLASFFFSVLMFFAVASIGRHIADRRAVLVGLTLLALSPFLIPLSFAVLTEPSYIATIYIGIAVYWFAYQRPKMWQAVLLGVIFGAAFLNRFEGLIYLGVIPVLQAAHYVFHKDRSYSLSRLVAWIMLYITVFLAVMAPQVWRVSNILGQFALNGRQVWSVMMQRDDGRPLKEKILGLDYSDREINISYLKRHGDAWRNETRSFDPAGYVKAFIRNFDAVYQHRLGELVGLLALVLFAFGLLALVLAERYFAAMLIVALIAANLVPPLLHNAMMRHIAVVAPLILLVAGIGVISVSELLGRHFNRKRLAGIVAVALIALSALFMIRPLVKAVWLRPQGNVEYSPQEIREPIRVLKEQISKEGIVNPAVTAQRGYLAHYAGIKQYYLPYAAFDKLVRFMELNNIHFLYIKHSRDSEYPFYETFVSREDPRFRRLYAGKDRDGNPVELWRFLPATPQGRAGATDQF